MVALGGSEQLEGQEAKHQFRQFRAVGGIQYPLMEVGSLRRWPLRQPTADLAEQVADVTACTVEIVPPIRVVTSVDPVQAQPSKDSVGVTPHPIPRAIGEKGGWLEGPGQATH